MHEDFKEEYDAALAEYSRIIKSLHDLLTEQSGLDEVKMRIITDEEAALYQAEIEARAKWEEARKKYFGTWNKYQNS
jgi:hypothetical protein